MYLGGCMDLVGVCPWWMCPWWICMHLVDLCTLWAFSVRVLAFAQLTAAPGVLLVTGTGVVVLSGHAGPLILALLLLYTRAIPKVLLLIGMNIYFFFIVFICVYIIKCPMLYYVTLSDLNL